MFSFDAFGTLGVVHSSEDKADFSSTIFKPDGAGHSDEWSANVDSLLGGQVTATLTSQLSAVVQVIAERNYDETYQPHVEWANIKYEFTPDFSVRVGRTVLPLALLSETRKVAYTYAWVRPPLETYRLIPLTNSDGVDVSYRFHAGRLTSTLQLITGRNDINVPNARGTLSSRHLRGITNSSEYGALTTHVAYLRSRGTFARLDRTLFEAFRQFGPQGVAIADEHSLNDSAISLVMLGANYDPGAWFVTAEWGHLKSTGFVGGTAWHASGGYRFGKFIPYVTYAQATADRLSDPGLDVATLPPDLTEQALALNAALNAILSSKTVQSTVAIGGRWDFMTNVSFKLQLEHIRIGAGSSGVLGNIQPGFQLGGQANIVSATFDFVF